MAEKTIVESFVLPSKGKIYGEGVKADFKLRSMTTADEMRRLSRTDTPYKTMAEVIEDCMIDKPGVSVYDMCLGDYQYCLHKLRIVTYGPEYKMALACYNCGNYLDMTTDLDTLDVLEWNEDFDKLKVIDLPRSKKKVELKIQTPRSLDILNQKIKDIQQRRKSKDDNIERMQTLISLIDKIDEIQLSDFELEKFYNNLPMQDTNMIEQSSVKLNQAIGLDTIIIAKCPKCEYEMITTFRTTPEFFRPTI